jgi:hypothetical protein
MRRSPTNKALVLTCVTALLAVVIATGATGATPPPGASATCRDGSYSFSTHRSGTCSHHGGVKTWLSGTGGARGEPASSLPPTAVGVTVLLARRTKPPGGCTLGPRPDRRCAGRLLLEAHKGRHLLVELPDKRDPERPRVCEVRRRARVRPRGEALREHARDRPHRLARARRVERHREPLPGASRPERRLSRQGQAREPHARHRLRRCDQPPQCTTSDRRGLACALQDRLRSTALMRGLRRDRN